MNALNALQSPAPRERGAVLVVGLIMLVVISLMGAVGYGVATQQERISGNTRDRMRAFESAEASLRDCERFLADPSVVVNPAAGVPGVVVAAAAGLPQLSETPPNDPMWKNAAPPRVRVLATALEGVAVQPSCLIEELVNGFEPAPGSQKMGAWIPVTIYRVTATGFGTRPDTTAKVQSSFRRY